MLLKGKRINFRVTTTTAQWFIILLEDHVPVSYSLISNSGQSEPGIHFLTALNDPALWRIFTAVMIKKKKIPLKLRAPARELGATWLLTVRLLTLKPRTRSYTLDIPFAALREIYLRPQLAKTKTNTEAFPTCGSNAQVENHVVRSSGFPLPGWAERNVSLVQNQCWKSRRIPTTTGLKYPPPLPPPPPPPPPPPVGSKSPRQRAAYIPFSD